jgi:membrane protease YdiL (CAAX protease family)
VGDWADLLLNLQAYFVIAGLALVLIGLGSLAAPHFWRQPLPMPRLRRGKWSGGEVLVALVGYLMVQIGVGDVISPIVPSPPEGDAGARQVQLARIAILGSPLIVALTLALVVTLLFAVSRTRPHHVGITWARWAANLNLGSMLFLVAAPVSLGIYYLVTQVTGVKKNPLEVAAEHGLEPWEWGFLAFMTVIGAPIVEEYLFRGVLQGWLRRASLLGHATLVIVVLVAGSFPMLAYLAAGLADADQKKALAEVAPATLLDAGLSLVFSTVLVGGYVFGFAGILKRRLAHDLQQEALAALARQRALEEIAEDAASEGQITEEASLPRLSAGAGPPPWAWAAAWLSIYGSAMLFAMAHGWPESVPLFVLGLGLGWLAYRTQSLIGGMVCHGLFNAVACLVLSWSR